MNQGDVSNPDPRIQDALTEFEKIKLDIIEDVEFEGQDVYIDGRHFRNCSFTRCQVFVKLGRWYFEDVDISGCQVVFDGPADYVKTLIDRLSQKQ